MRSPTKNWQVLQRANPRPGCEFDQQCNPRPASCAEPWENLTWVNGRNGSLLVTRGKTKAARRALPMTPGVRSVLEARWLAVGKPSEGWLWPAPTERGHIDHSSIKKQHAKAFRTVNAEARKNRLALITPFVLYSFRAHVSNATRTIRLRCLDTGTYRGAQFDNDLTALRTPSEDTVLAAFSRLGGHTSGHSEFRAVTEGNAVKQLTDSGMYN